MSNNVTYTNPASLSPLNTMDAGPLKGMLQYDQMKDYRQGMDIQNFIQQLGGARAGQEHQEFMQGAPLRALEQQGKTETLQGQLPFLRELSGATAQRDTASAQFDTGTKYSDPAKQDYFRQLRQKASDDEWRNYGRELQAGFQVVSEAQNIAQNKGQMAGVAHMQQALAGLKSRGINLPPAFADPDNWGAIRRATLDSLEHVQKVELENQKGAYALEGVRLHNEGTLAAAHEKASLDRNQNLDQHMAHLWNLIRTGTATDADKGAFEQHVFRKWSDTLSRRQDLQVLNLQSQQGGAQGQAAARQLKAEQDQFFQGYGLKPRGPGYNSKEDVKKAYNEGKIDRLTALKELKKFGGQ